jgi:ferric-dicitrate binding protein FerR (iron transport regulator)
VLKHLDSEASPAEEAALQHWLEADLQHRLEYEALEKIWRESGKVLNTRSFNVEAALEKVEDRLAIRAPASAQPLPSSSAMPLPPSFARSFPWKWSLAAASVLLVLGSAGWWYFIRESVNVIRAGMATLQVVLPDGSLVHLRKGAILHYSGSFMEEKAREVELSGEAFFEPVYNPFIPFRIRTAHAVFQDIGTSFLVKDSAATDELTVVTGKVKFTERADPSNSLILTPGQQALLAGNRFITSATVDKNVISWKTGILDFKDQPLQEVAADITDYFQTPVILSPDLSEKARATRVTARFDHQPLKEVLEEIQLMTGLSTRHEKGSFVFSQ